MKPLFLAGDFVSTRESKPVINPWDFSEIAQVCQADESAVEKAIATANQAAKQLRLSTVHSRRLWLSHIANSIESEAEALATLISQEAGKPLVMAYGEVARAAETFRLGSEECLRLGGDVMHLEQTMAHAGTVGGWTRVSSGVLLAITPFNFPLNLVAHKLSPAFALGMPVVLKPAPQTPLTALKLAEIISNAGAPRGLLSVLPTSNALAQRMVQDPRFAALSFTGSAKVGWNLKEIAGKKRVMLELGGNASVVLAPDAAMEKAIPSIINAAFAYAGQVCIKAQQVFVHRSMYERFLSTLLAQVKTLRASDPMINSTLCGPLIDTAAANRVRSWVEQATSQGAQILCGMTGESNRIDPALVIGARRGMTLVDEEIFGPVLLVHAYDSLAECFDEIDSGRYGLQCSLFTDSVPTIRQAYAALSVGALIVNDATAFRVDAMPYGGTKDSGLGREGVRFAIDELAEKKLLVMR